MATWIRLAENDRGALSPRMVRWHQEREDAPGVTLCGITFDAIAERRESDSAPPGYTACGLCKRAADRRRVYIEHYRDRPERVIE